VLSLITLLLTYFNQWRKVDASEQRKGNFDTKESRDLQAKEAVNLITLSKGKKIIAFGDSLTAGYYLIYRHAKPRFHPYIGTLSQMVNDSSLQIIESGLSAEITQHMLGRLPDILSLNPGFKVVIILAGTNDLWGLKNELISMNNIKKLHRIALTGNMTEPVYTVAITIPEIKEYTNTHHRLILNEGIKSLSHKCSQRIALLDFESAFNQSVPGNIEKYWSPDEIHLSPHGYDKVISLAFLVSHDITLIPIFVHIYVYVYKYFYIYKCIHVYKNTYIYIHHRSERCYIM
jgi:lysophospholipase L1-like esterase